MNSISRAFEGPETVQDGGPNPMRDDSTVESRDSRSSVGSFLHHDGPITFADLVDLTGPTKCRVLMNGRTSRRVFILCYVMNRFVTDPLRICDGRSFYGCAAWCVVCCVVCCMVWCGVWCCVGNGRSDLPTNRPMFILRGT